MYLALFVSSKHCTTEVCSLLLDLRPGLAREENAFGFLPVHAAAFEWTNADAVAEMCRRDTGLANALSGGRDKEAVTDTPLNK